MKSNKLNYKKVYEYFLKKKYFNIKIVSILLFAFTYHLTFFIINKNLEHRNIV